MKKLSALVVLLSLTIAAFGQQSRVSPHTTTEKGDVSVTYGQPSKKDREIFGGLVPYREVWRTGADEATEITFKKDGTFGGKPVKAGTYALFTIPDEDNWTIILNDQLKQWGAFKYEQFKDKDVLHVTEPVQHLNKSVERFTITVMRNSLLLEWDRTSIKIPFDFN